MMLQSYFATIPTFLLLLFFLQTLADLNTEKQALLDFAAAVHHGHAQRVNWNPATSICSSWVGITCSPSGSHVLAVRLPAVGLRGSLPANTLGTRETGRTPLDWESRLKTSLGAAKGIAHIHSASGRKFVHGNIKSSNVLLTVDLQGCISDFGLTPLISSSVPSRSPGYRAPEVIETRKSSQKSDVYSFGVVLLEMLTGKTPVQYSGHDDVVDLPKWVQSVVREEWTAEVFDLELMRYPNIEEELVQMLQLAMACVTRVPDTRPSMEEVVRIIDEIRASNSENQPSFSEDKTMEMGSPSFTPYN